MTVPKLGAKVQAKTSRKSNRIIEEIQKRPHCCGRKKLEVFISYYLIVF
jgi:hypothetical protein